MTLRNPHAVAAYRREQNVRYRPEGYALFACGRGVEMNLEWNVTLETSQMDRLIDWKLCSPAHTLEDPVIRQFTLELRVNYADADKNEVMRQAIAHAARHVLATASLIADGVKPDIACWSDDWFAGKQEINILDDVIQQGIDEQNDASESSVSSELMAAVRDGA
jgi:hypothetical protein